MPETARICHASPGRLRLRIPDKRHDRDYFAHLTEVFSPLPGIDSVEANPVTASVLLRHRLDTDRVLQLAENCEAMTVTRETTRSVPLAARVATELRAFDRAVRDFTDGELDLLSLLIIVLLGMAVAELLAGNVGVPATTLGWYALSILLLAPADVGTRDSFSNA